MQILKLGFTSQHCVDRTQQPVEVEVIPGLVPLAKLTLHLIAAFRPLGADFRKGKIALGELGAAAVNPVEDIHHHVKRLVRASDLLGVQVYLQNAQQVAQSTCKVADFWQQLRLLAEGGDKATDSGRPLFHQGGNIDPQGIILHLDRLVKLEGLRFQIKTQTRKCLSITIKELGWLAPRNTVQ